MGTTITLTAAVEFAPAETASGTVNFSDSGASVGSTSLDPEGVGALKISTLAVGAHNLTAAYLGNTVTAASMSSAVTVTITAKKSVAMPEGEPGHRVISSAPDAATHRAQKIAMEAGPETLGCNQTETVAVLRQTENLWTLYCADDISLPRDNTGSAISFHDDAAFGYIEIQQRSMNPTVPTP